MGMLGDIVYPNNKTMAEDLNKKYQQLLDNNALQNNLTNSYHDLASSISSFDGYLMAILCMQYAIAYDDEKLANLPATDIPKLSQSIADDNQKIEQAIQDERALNQNLGVLRSYLLDIGMDALAVYQNSTGLQFNPLPLSANTPQDLTFLNDQMVKMIERLEGANGNAFMIFRVIIRLITDGKVAKAGATDAQLDYLAQQLYLISSVSAVFPSQDAVRQFVANFFQGHLLVVLPTFLQLPPMPDAIRSMVSQTPSQQSIFDLNSAQYDQPADLDLSDLP